MAITNKPKNEISPMAKKLMEKDFLKKNGTIMISNALSHAQKSCWNILYAFVSHNNAFDQQIHTIKESDLKTLLGVEKCHDQAHLKKTLTTLRETSVSWNKYGSGRCWGAASLLSAFVYKDGYIRYEFPKLLIEKFQDTTEPYTKLRLNITEKIAGGHSEHAYELCKKWYDVKRGVGESKWIPIEEFRAMFGIQEKEYKLFKHLNDRVIKKIKKEINETTDLEIDIEFQKESRRVSALKFIVRLKKILLPSPEDKNAKTITSLSKKALKLKEQLQKEFSISEYKALQILNQFDTGHITANIKYTQAESMKKKISKLSGFLIKAIEDNYAEYTRKSTEKVLNPEQLELANTLQAEFDFERIQQAQLITFMYPVEYIKETLRYVVQEHQKTPKESISGFVISALKDNYANSENYKKQF